MGQNIIVNKEQMTFTLNTNNSSYQMKVDKYKRLLHTWYGGKISGADYSYLVEVLGRGFSGNPGDVSKAGDRDYTLDLLPQEFPQHGTGDYRINALDLVWENGARGTDFVYKDHKVIAGKPELQDLPHFWTSADNKEAVETLVVVLEDLYSDLELELYYSIFPEYDLIVRSSKITNLGNEEVVLKNIASGALDFINKDFELINFPGRHLKERNASKVELGENIFQIRSTRGTSSHQQNPSLFLQEQGACEDKGEVYGLSLVYSGGFNISCEKDQLGQIRVVAGLDDSNFSWILKNGESFQTPELAMCYSPEGRGELSRNLHRAVNNNLIRSSWADKRRPVLINNWEATYFDFDKDKILEIANKAKELNFDLLVLDDGWFGKRDLDISGLGDWIPNETKIGGTLEDLIKDVNDLGLDFGIWMEPEMVNEDSDLYRAHPDWALAIPGREPNRSRVQLVLDFSRKDVQDFAISAIDNVLQTGNITYLKWDMNRSLFDLYSHSLPAEKQGELSHRYVLGVYRVLQHLLDNYPDLLIEGCSGGGGRFDLGMLYYTPQIWTSDNTDALDRTRIQHGTSFVYPLSSISAHVSAVPNHQNHRVTPISTRAFTALQGAFGYEMDLSTLSESEQEFTKKFIDFYNKHWETVQKGDYYRLVDPYENTYVTAWENVATDKAEAILTVVYKDLAAAGLAECIKWKGLCKDSDYKLTLYKGSEEFDCGVYSGLDLMVAGILVERGRQNYDSVCYIAEKV